MSAYQDDQRQRAREGQQPGADGWQGALALTGQGALAAQAPAGPETEGETEGAYGSIEPISGREVLANIGRSLRDAPLRLWAVIRGLNGEQWAWIAVLALAALLRFWDLGAKPLHHDESMHAFYSLLFARDPASYAYDPLLHGPFQFHAEGFMFALVMVAQNLFHISSPGNNPWINDTTARFVPALFGLGIVALPIGLRRELGRLGAWLAALLLAVSPAFVYFSRFLREDIYFNFFMFAMVVCAVRFASDRSAKWLALTAASAVLAYATFEGIYITLAIFGGFLALLVAWELAGPVSRIIPATYTAARRLLLGRVIALLALAGIGMAVAAWALHTMKTLSAYIQANTKASDVQVALLEQRTVAVLLYVSIGIAALVILSLFWQITRENALYDYRQRIAADEDAAEAAPEADAADDAEYTDFSDLAEPPAPGWIIATDRILGAPGRGIAALRQRADPERQPLLHLLLSTPWTQWFIAFVVGWMLFAGLYWELPTTGRSLGQGFVDGVGKGVWQGLYYWLQQQNVARGAQPLYYYFVLIPLY
ncbi:MAG: TIGR03663 family protein, partial [Chloroflexota bacterium]|nr:TIGR03663 family protein [Chloroflexota bacterium]